MTDTITIRQAEQRDAEVLRRLAAIDHRPPLAGPVLVAAVAGIPLAAIALGSGAVVADRSRPALDAVRLLRRRRYRLLRQGGDVGVGSSLLRRPGRATQERRLVLRAV